MRVIVVIMSFYISFCIIKYKVFRLLIFANDLLKKIKISMNVFIHNNDSVLCVRLVNV